jgi:hypothetical protein
MIFDFLSKMLTYYQFKTIINEFLKSSSYRFLSYLILRPQLGEANK